jgi:hypothetical protein
MMVGPEGFEPPTKGLMSFLGIRPEINPNHLQTKAK